MNKRLDASLEILAFAQYHKEFGDAELWKSDDLGVFWDCPPRYFENRLQWLVNHGYLVGVRGPRGGYHYAGDNTTPTVTNVIVDWCSEPTDNWLLAMLGDADATPADLMPVLYRKRHRKPFNAAHERARFANGSYTEATQKIRRVMYAAS